VKVDQAPEGGKARMIADASLDGVAGAWGDGDMYCVTVNASGFLVAAAIGDAIGVIKTDEGRETTSDGSHKNIIGGRKYTVFSRAEFVEADIGTSPALAAGDQVFVTTSGDVLTTGAVGARCLGWVDNTGKRLVLDVGLLPNA